MSTDPYHRWRLALFSTTLVTTALALLTLLLSGVLG
jgi:hypothetical protein